MLLLLRCQVKLTLLLGQFTCLCLLQFGNACQTLGTKQTTAPMFTDLITSIIEVCLDDFDEFRQVGPIGGFDLCECNGRACLATDQCTQTCFALHNAVWNAHFAAQGWQKEDNFNWIDIVGDDNQRGFLLFNQFGDRVGAVTHKQWLLFRLNFLALGLRFGGLLQALLLGQLRFWTIFLQQFEQLNGILFVQCLRKLMDWWWDLQSLLQNGFLALHTNIFRPTNETGQITFWLDVLS